MNVGIRSGWWKDAGTVMARAEVEGVGRACWCSMTLGRCLRRVGVWGAGKKAVR